MNKTALTALFLALFLPLAGYFFVKVYSKDAIHMPGRYFYDTVLIKEKGGKTTMDTMWHIVRNIRFINQYGKEVSLDDAKGKIIVLNFFFTRCPSICPRMTTAMKKVQGSFTKNPEIVQFISITADPEHDSAANLRRFADRFNANQDNWWFVTGDKKDIYDFAFTEIKASIADTDVDTAFIHTENTFLLDSNRVVRGWYNAFDTSRQAQLAKDIPTLMLEKDHKRPSILRNFIPLLPITFIGIAIVMIVTYFLNKKKQPF